MTTADRATRREQIGRAVWDIIRRDGIAQASVRNVASEADMSVGSLRHYFPTQNELLAYSMQHVIDTIAARIGALEPVTDTRERVQLILEQVLPLDAERRSESEVWLAFAGVALNDDALRVLRDASDDKMRLLCARVVEQLAPGLDEVATQIEAERLDALLDGLLVHAVSRPDLLKPAIIRKVLTRHLDELSRAT